MLIALFELADASGGLVALRLLGCLAVTAVVLLSARTSCLLGGRRAGRWSALVAGALLFSPLVGAQEVNGELLSAPIVALGILATVQATRLPSGRSRTTCSLLAGAAAVAAVLVKQNMADVVVFGSVFLTALVLTRRLGTRGPLRIAAGAALGGLAAAAVTAMWTVAHGTSLIGVFDATYPFRLQAAQVVATEGAHYASMRLSDIAGSWLLSGLALLTLALVVSALGGRLRDPALTALTATALYDTFSVGLGGGYWPHYLVEMVVPLAIGTGLLVARRGQAHRLAAIAATGLSVVAALHAPAHPPDPTGEQLGAAIGRVAHTGDTLTTLYGQPQANLVSGLPSPYEHLWSLPIRTLDPQLTGLDAVLGGPKAPTWLIVTRQVTSWGLNSTVTQALITSRYHPVGQLGGQTVYLLDTADRAAPDLAGQTD